MSAGSRSPWRMRGPDDGAERPALNHALRALHEADRRAPTDNDRPAPSTFPGRVVKRLPGQLAIGEPARDVAP